MYVMVFGNLHVWIPGYGGSKVRVRGTLPFILESRAVDTAQAHVRHPTGGDVEAGSNGDDIELVDGAVFGLDTLWSELLNGVGADIHNIYIGTVELLVVVLL